MPRETPVPKTVPNAARSIAHTRSWCHVARIVAVACVLPGPAYAQLRDTTDAEVARMPQEQFSVTDDDIARATARYGQLSIEVPTDTAAPRSPNLDALPTPLHGTPADLGAISEGYRQQIQAATPVLDSGPTLYLFVSLSMPEPTLRRLIAQAGQARATVLVRGLSEGSLRKTAARLQALIGDAPVSLQIDPRPFDRFAVQRVPAFVLSRTATNIECEGAACPVDPAFVRTSGDVSLDYALAYIQRSAPNWSAAAGIYLQRLERRE